MLNNTSQSYGWISICLHWSMALGLFFMFALGLYMVELDYYHRWYRDAPLLHKSLGILMLILWMARILNRQLQTAPCALAAPRWQQLTAKFTHALLYVFMLILMLSGYLISTADGRPIQVFNWFALPALPIHFEQQADIAGDIHWLSAWVLCAAVLLHAATALKHQFIYHDNGLKRMLKPENKI